jgi:hypothetical protein
MPLTPLAVIARQPRPRLSGASLMIEGIDR